MTQDPLEEETTRDLIDEGATETTEEKESFLDLAQFLLVLDQKDLIDHMTVEDLRKKADQEHLLRAQGDTTNLTMVHRPTDLGTQDLQETPR